MALLKMQDVTKRFPGTVALSRVQLEVLPGEIHAIVGENGAGKSTLMKILSGVYQADEGEIQFEGRAIAPANPREALALGIAIVHQELSVVPALTVGENIFPGRLPTNRFGMVRFDQLFRDAQRILDKMQVPISPRELVGNLSVANQQLVEIAKALSLESKLLILDEPTSALTERETEILLDLLRRLAESGVSIVYISHKLGEVFKLADRITVLRDGQYVGTQVVAQTTPEIIVRMMVGRELGDFYPAKNDQRGAALLEVRDLQLRKNAAPNTFSLYQGEILGFAGLIGSGRTELARAIFGADPRLGGMVLLDGQPLEINSPGDAIAYGIGYVPEDRKAAGLFLDMAIKANIEASNLRAVTARGFIVPAKETQLAREYVARLAVMASSTDQEVRRLSGGNQQKVLLAKWLAIQPRVLIVDEPTRGIDVGAKREIHYLLRTLASQGVGVIIISSELPEVLGMSDRILVMRNSTIVGELSALEASEERIMQYASQGTAETAHTAGSLLGAL